MKKQTKSKSQRTKERKSDIAACKYDWVNCKLDYIEGVRDDSGKLDWPTLNLLSERHNIPYNYLRMVAGRDKWKIERQAFIDNFEDSKKIERIKYLSKEANKFDNRCIDIVNKGMKVIEEIFEVSESSIDENGNKRFLGLENLESITKSLDKLQRIGRLALGVSTDNVNSKTKFVSGTSFAEGLEKINQQIESNVDLKNKLIEEMID
jgi:regulator of sigma D